MEVSVTSLRDAGVVPLAAEIYATLEHTTAPRFANQRLHLPCIIFTVTQLVQLAPTRSQEQNTYFTYAVKANGLDDLVIITEDKITPFSRRKPIRQKLLLVRPWDRILLDAGNFVQSSNPAGDVQTVTTEASRTIRGSVLTTDPESAKRALGLLVRLGQPFRGFLLEQQWGEEYKRIAADHDIIAQVKVVASVRDMMDIRTLEIL